MSQCVICNNDSLRDDAAVLVMSPFGTPRLLCEECEADIVTATTSRDFDEILGAIERISKKVSLSQTIDGQSYDAVKEILETAGKRAAAIRDGTYDFSLDDTACEPKEDELDDIPDELRETEEDAELDRRDEEFERKFNKVFTWVSIGAFAAVGAFILWRLLDMWVF